ncbi:MAG: hypothetical protein AAF491_06555 [Verrucomicrobiota bacterium]
MRTVSAILAIFFLTGSIEAEDDPRFLDLWMEGFLTLQSAHNKERAGEEEEATRLYSQSLDHYRSMRYYWAGSKLAAQLEDRIQLLAKKLNSLGVDPYQEYSALPDSNALLPKPEGLGPELPTVPSRPSNWKSRGNDSVLVPLVETPETRRYHEERIQPLLEKEQYRRTLLSGR